MKKDDRLGWNTEQEYNTRKQAVISPHFSRDCRNLARGSGLELPPTSSGTAQMKHDAELGEGGAPTLLRFCPRDEYLSTFDMLQDHNRNQAYRKAVRLVATKLANSSSSKVDFRWLDIGTGSGLLASLVAAASPALTSTTEVYACEGVENVADVAAKTFDKNGRSVRLFRGRSTEMEVGRDISSRVPLVISELLGTGLLDEGVIPTMRDAKRRLLEPGFVSIPSSAEVWAFCCESLELERMSRLCAPGTENFCAPSSEPWKRCPGTAAPASMHVRLPHWGGVNFCPLSPSVRLFDFNFATLPGSSGRKCGVRFPVDVLGTVHAVVCWWRCFMDKERTVVMSTSPEDFPSEPYRDHWRQSVYLLTNPVRVGAGDVVRAITCHDDHMIWFDGVGSEKGPPDSTVDVSGGVSEPQERRIAGTKSATEVAAVVSSAGVGSPAVEPSTKGVDYLACEAAPSGGEHNGAGVAQELVGAGPPVCLCGLHRTCSPSRIWMLNDESRTAAFRSAIRASLGCHRRAEEYDRDSAGIQEHVVCACVSDGFLLPLLAAQEGASEILDMQSSGVSGAMWRDVYRANGIDDGKIRAFPGGAANFYDLLSPPPESLDVFDGVGKLDAVVGEPFFADVSSAWPLESLLLFWCVRTALEARGCFSPRTRVIPGRARLLACPFASNLLFRARRRVGTVEGIDMSAVNDGLGCTRGGRGGQDVVAQEEEEEAEGTQAGNIESVRLHEYPHVLLGPPTVVLDMDLTRPLCDLRGGRTETRCCCRYAKKSVALNEEKEGVICHGVALWLDIWLDEEGHHRLSTGPDVPYWPQGLLFFEGGWLVPPCGRSFHLEAILEDGALKVDIS